MANDDQVLLAEYNNCAEVANHIDNVRNVITSFFLTLNGGVLLALSFIANGDVSADTFGSPKAILAGLMVAVSVLGTIFTATIARLRRVQTERFRIANGILDHVLSQEARPVVPLANSTLSSDAGGAGLNKRTTGSYLWTLAVILPTAMLTGLGGYYIAVDIHGVVGGAASWLATCALAATAFILQDVLYFRLARFDPPSPSDITASDESTLIMDEGSHASTQGEHHR